MSNNHEIILENICFSYKQRNILENVNLEIQKGEFASIVGPNGGGKTTLLKLILGLIKPDRGKIQIFGKSPDKAKHHIGYMPQYAHLDMNFPASVMDVVLMGRLEKKNLWFSRKDRIKAVVLGDTFQVQRDEVYINMRHKECLTKAQNHIILSHNAVSYEEMQDLISIDIKAALLALDEIVGENKFHVISEFMIKVIAQTNVCFFNMTRTL